MKLSITVLVTTLLSVATAKCGLADHCDTKNEGALRCDKYSVSVCHNGCWNLDTTCANGCIQSPKPHCA
ncbi:hypothetical protein ACEQ8H_004587 [Pleosporales sp. CAS-2024a]